MSGIADVTAVFPGAVLTPRERLNTKWGGHAPVTETGVVPVGLAVQLDHAVLQQSTFTVTAGGVAMTIVPWEIAPAAGEVAVDYDNGVLRFNAARAGAALSVAYTPWGSVPSAGWDLQMQAELAAVQSAVGASADVFTVGQGAQYATIGAALVAVAALTRGADEWAVVRVLPGTYEEAVIVSAPRVVLLGVGGPEAVTVRHDHNDDLPGEWQPAIAVRASDVVVCGITAKNLYPINPPGDVPATIALGVGTRDGLSVCERVVFRDCEAVVTGRDAFYARCGGTVRIDGNCRLEGYSHTSAFDTSAGDDAVVNTLTVEMQNVVVKSVFAPIWCFVGNAETLLITQQNVLVLSGESEPVFYLNGRTGFGGVITIWARDVNAPGMSLFQDTDTAAITTTTIYTKNVSCAQGRIGTVYSTVTVVDEPVAGVSAWGDLSAGGDVMAGGSIAAGGNLAIGGAVAPTITEFDETVLALSAFNSGETVLEIAASDFDPGTQDFRIIRPAGDYELHATHLKDGAGTLDASGITRRATLTTKGDTYVATGAGTLVRMPAPPAGHALVADPAQPTGWASVWVPRVVWQTTTDSAELVGTVSTEQDFDQTYTIEANTFAVGQVWRAVFSGYIAGNGTSETARIRLRLGGTVIADSANRSTINSPGGMLSITSTLIVREIGSSGKLISTFEPQPMVGYASGSQGSYLATVNTTADLILKGTMQWTGTNAANKAKMLSCRLERLA